MTCLNRLFTIKELEKLDEKQLAILDDRIRHEMRTSGEISKILRKKLSPLYKQFARSARPARRKRK
jgi:hypothetical protein